MEWVSPQFRDVWLKREEEAFTGTALSRTVSTSSFQHQEATNISPATEPTSLLAGLFSGWSSSPPREDVENERVQQLELELQKLQNAVNTLQKRQSHTHQQLSSDYRSVSTSTGSTSTNMQLQVQLDRSQRNPNQNIDSRVDIDRHVQNLERLVASTQQHLLNLTTEFEIFREQQMPERVPPNFFKFQQHQRQHAKENSQQHQILRPRTSQLLECRSRSLFLDHMKKNGEVKL